MNYIDIASTLHTRGVDIDMNEYLFGLMLTDGEDKEAAYAIAFEPSEFKKNLGDEEGLYLASKRQAAEALMNQQNIKMMLDYMADIRRSEIQAQALNLEEYHFSGEDTVRILNNLLKTRINDLESSSVKDVVAILKTLTESGGIDAGDGGFSKHFVQIFPKFSALCCKCGKEFDAQRGLGAVCPHCHQEYRWSEEENRYYPEPIKL